MRTKSLSPFLWWLCSHCDDINSKYLISTSPVAQCDLYALSTWLHKSHTTQCLLLTSHLSHSISLCLSVFLSCKGVGAWNEKITQTGISHIQLQHGNIGCTVNWTIMWPWLQWQMCTGPYFSGVCCQQCRVIPLQLQNGREAITAYLINYIHKRTQTPQELKDID